MAIRDRYLLPSPVLWGWPVLPFLAKSELSQGRGLSVADQKLLPRCKSLRDDRNIGLLFSGAFVAASGMMAKAFRDRYPGIPDNHKPRYQVASKIITLVPLGIALLFFKSAYQDNLLYQQCLQDPRGTLERLAAEEKVDDSKRVSLTLPEIVSPASWLAGAAVAARTMAYYGAALMEGAMASGLALCAPGLRYFNADQKGETIL